MSFLKTDKTVKRMMFFLLCGLLVSCGQQDKVEEEVAKIPMDFKVDRFDKVFAEAQPSDLPRLKRDYPQFFPKQYSDSTWIRLMTDSLQIQLNEEVVRIFPDFDTETAELKKLFQHLKYYDSTFVPPHVYTVISQVDYNNRVLLSDSLLIIGLDNYLGSEHRFYTGIQRYFAKNFEKDQIAVNVAEQYAEASVPKPKGRSLIDFMIYKGKILYFKQLMLPHHSPASIIGYTKKEWEWAEANERHIWGYLIENQFLFETNADLKRRFLEEGPFTRFGLELDNESPAKLGRYIGWKVVDQYVKKTGDKNLKDLLRLENKSLFEEANYKPKQN